VLAQGAGTFATTIRKDTLKTKDMNTDNALAFISSMISSETSYNTLMDMINEMDLELMDICMA
jgi:hypothetical protein